LRHPIHSVRHSDHLRIAPPSSAGGARTDVRSRPITKLRCEKFSLFDAAYSTRGPKTTTEIPASRPSDKKEYGYLMRNPVGLQPGTPQGMCQSRFQRLIRIGVRIRRSSSAGFARRRWPAVQSRFLLPAAHSRWHRPNRAGGLRSTISRRAQRY